MRRIFSVLLFIRFIDISIIKHNTSTNQYNDIRKIYYIPLLVFDFTRFGVELTGGILIELIAALKFWLSSLFGYDGDIHDGDVTCCCTRQIKYKKKEKGGEYEVKRM